MCYGGDVLHGHGRRQHHGKTWGRVLKAGGPAGEAAVCILVSDAEHMELHETVDVLLQYESMLCGREYEQN